MKISQLTATIIEADEDKYLTQSDEAIETKDRIVVKKLALGKFDTPENYIEISVEEADAIKEEKEKLMLEEIEKV